jgi:hypothetical protein
MAYHHQFLTPSRGVWYFQRWVSIKIDGVDTPQAVNYRKSLRTKDIRIAKQRARKLAVKLDDLIKQHFMSDSEFSDAMAFYHRAIVQNLSLEEYEEMGWGDPHDDVGFSREDLLLTKATQFSKHVNYEFHQLQNRVQNLETLLEKSQQINEQFDLKKEIDRLNLDAVDDASNPTLDSLFDEYKSWASNQKQMVALNSIYIPSIELFLRFLQSVCGSAQIRTNDVTPDLAKQYVRFYANIPKGVQIKNASIESLTGLSGETKTQKTIEVDVRGCWKYASKELEANGDIVVSPFCMAS